MATPKLTEEMRRALAQQPGIPLEIEDEATRQLYLIIPKEAFGQLVDEQLRRQLQIGFDQADAGDVVDWDIDAFLDRMHRQHGIGPS